MLKGGGKRLVGEIVGALRTAANSPISRGTRQSISQCSALNFFLINKEIVLNVF